MCAAEILEWKDKALLRDGKIREIARSLSAIGTNALDIAEVAVEHAALELAAVQRLAAGDSG